MNNTRKPFKLILLLFPALAGFCGFLLSGTTSVLDGLFRCLTMYVMNYGDTPPNLLVEIARWTAPLATASGVLLAIASVNERLRNWRLAKSGDSIAVYGPEEEQDALLEQIGAYGIRGRDSLVQASRYILADSEEKNLAFYAQHRRALENCMVYLKCSSMRVQSSPNVRVKLYTPEETAARLFWKRHCLYRLSAEHDHKLSIVLIGSGRLGEELLYWGLQDNLFSPGQQITYHVFGDCDAFLSVHPELKQLEDAVIPHDEPWYHALTVLQQAQLILVVKQTDQIELLQKLLLIPRLPKMVCFSALDAQTELFGAQGQPEWFCWQAEANRLEHILEDRLFRLAKAINLRYASLYAGVEENDETREAEWEKLDVFTRYSNISAADYHEIRLLMLEQMGCSRQLAQIPPETMELLSELEHMRWCRYHYLNNWTCGVPKTGKRKDTALRIHQDLVRYGDLTEEEKQKDRDNICVLLSVEP